VVEVDLGGEGGVGGEISEGSVVRRLDYLPEDAAFGSSSRMKLGAISAITSLTTIIAGNLTRRVAIVGPLHSAARKLAEKIPS